MNKASPNKSNQKDHISKNLHPKNLHNYGYDFPALIKSHPALNTHVKKNIYQNQSIDFSDPTAVKTLNNALLRHYYGIVEWDIPEGFLCPPIPGRVDYIHYVADLLKVSRSDKHIQTRNATVKMLDIGTGANGIYSILACQVYGWHCTASDIDPISLANVANIASKNPVLSNCLQLRFQPEENHIFEGIIQSGEYFDVSVCNPPFHASLKEALQNNKKKVENLALNRKEKSTNKISQDSPTLNFGGQKAELWCKGGESRFLITMIKESKIYSSQCQWFTTLISKNENVNPAKKLLHKLQATNIKEIEMKQGNKITRILAWTFLRAN